MEMTEMTTIPTLPQHQRRWHIGMKEHGLTSN
jgi:hypothetical protein